MDLSKLPRLSETKENAEPSPSLIDTPIEPLNEKLADSPKQDRPRQEQPLPISYPPQSIGGDIWVSLIIGLLLSFLGGTFARYLLATLTHQPFHTGVNWTEGPNAGNEVSYFELEGFTAWSDMGIFLFGLTLLFEAGSKTLLILKPGTLSRLMLMLAIALTLLAVALNIICCIKLMSVSITPMLSGLAVAFGGWALFDELATLKRTPPARPGVVT